jgi:hypothetical protein
MLKSGNKYIILLSIIMTIIIIAGCGGENSGYAGTISTQTPSPVFIASTATPVPTVIADISGYAYNITSTDEGTNGVIIVDVPINTTDSSGNASLLTQVSTYLQEEEPIEWATSSCQESYNELVTALSGSQPLTNGQITTDFQDPNSSGLSINQNGYFQGQVPVSINENNVELEIMANEDESYDIETTIDSSLSSSSTSKLEVCPKRIFVLSGGVTIFKINSSENLKSSGLTFSINNTSLGYVSKPIYLCIGGKKKYSQAYGYFYAKNNLITPVDTIITAKTNTGLSLDIFVEVVKNTASISGKVFTGDKQLIKGYVKSIGPKAHCKLDSAGNYLLPRTYSGHYRKVVAVWWTLENNKKVKHRQVKVIDFFNENLTGFNFGEEIIPTPTATEAPTATPTLHDFDDPFYTNSMSKVFVQYNQWEAEVGIEAALQKIIDWLNGNTSIPHPEEINKAVKDKNNPYKIHIYFVDGMGVYFEIEQERIELYDNKLKKKNKNTLLLPPRFNKIPSTVSSSKILILAPFVWEEEENGSDISLMVYSKIKDDLEKANYKVDCVMTRKSDYDIIDNPVTKERVLMVKKGCEKNIVTPYDFSHMNDYGIIYIATHSNEQDLVCSLMFSGDPNTNTWMKEHYKENISIDPNNGNWGTGWKYGRALMARNLYFNKKFFSQQKFKNSIVFINGCYSWQLADAFCNRDNGAKVYIGYDNKTYLPWAGEVAYKFFYYMMYGTNGLENQTEPNALPPMNVGDACNRLTTVDKLNPLSTEYPHDPNFTRFNECVGCQLHKYSENDETYFPAPVEITIKDVKKR